MRKIAFRYRINRSWGDGICEALWNAVRGRSFPSWENVFGSLDDWEGK